MGRRRVEGRLRDMAAAGVQAGEGEEEGRGSSRGRHAKKIKVTKKDKRNHPKKAQQCRGKGKYRFCLD